jgi:MoaA/NifB/PqqE/SkfB family radical SAM enzyme
MGKDLDDLIEKGIVTVGITDEEPVTKQEQPKQLVGKVRNSWGWRQRRSSRIVLHDEELAEMIGCRVDQIKHLRRKGVLKLSDKGIKGFWELVEALEQAGKRPSKT